MKSSTHLCIDGAKIQSQKENSWNMLPRGLKITVKSIYSIWQENTFFLFWERHHTMLPRFSWIMKCRNWDLEIKRKPIFFSPLSLFISFFPSFPFFFFLITVFTHIRKVDSTHLDYEIKHEAWMCQYKYCTVLMFNWTLKIEQLP